MAKTIISWGLQYKLAVLSPINDRGEYTDEVPEYAGVHVFKANPLIVERMKDNNSLIFTKTIEHSYPHCWRSKTPLIYRATSQWFIRMDDKNYNIRKMALGEIEKTQFFPDWGVKRLTAMIEARPDWCISRQRNWGVPIPVFYCNKCEHAHMTEDMIYHIADLMEKSGGMEAYFEGSTEELLKGNTKCPSCGANDWKKGTDILDVWFDSGSSHAAVQTRRDGLEMPADLYLEGSDQHRGWFQTSLISSVASQGKAPFKTLLTHNFVNDEHGRKMSKSLGNYVDPMELIKTSGAELLRLWTSSQDYGQDMNFSQEGFKRISETYRRYRNTFRFLVGNIHDFNANKDYVTYEKLQPLDQWALTRLNELITTVTEAYSKYEYFKVYHALNNYFTVDLSAHYLDILKDRLYTWKTDGVGRRSAQTVLFEITKSLVTMMAPITSFLSEETYSYFVGKTEESVFLTDFPKANAKWKNDGIAKEFETLFALRSEVSKQLEDMRRDKVIGSSLEAQVNLTSSDTELTVLNKYLAQLPEFFIVSHVTVQSGKRNIITQKATGHKCPRCWYYSDNIGKNPAHPQICPKCTEALS